MEISICKKTNFRHYTLDGFTYCHRHFCDLNEDNCCNIDEKVLFNLFTLCNVYNLETLNSSCGGIYSIRNNDLSIDIFYFNKKYEIEHHNMQYTDGIEIFGSENIYDIYKHLDDNFPNLRREITMQKIVILE